MTGAKDESSVKSLRVHIGRCLQLVIYKTNSGDKGLSSTPTHVILLSQTTTLY